MTQFSVLRSATLKAIEGATTVERVDRITLAWQQHNPVAWRDEDVLAAAWGRRVKLENHRPVCPRGQRPKGWHPLGDRLGQHRKPAAGDADA